MNITNEINAHHAPCQPTHVELHLAASPELPKRFGKQIKAAGGKYSECRGYQDKRFVTVPISEVALINELITSYPGFGKTAVIFRGFSVRLGNCLAAATVKSVPNGQTIEVAWKSFVASVKGEPVQAALADHYKTEAGRRAADTRKVQCQAETDAVAQNPAVQAIVAALVSKGYEPHEITNIMSAAARVNC